MGRHKTADKLGSEQSVKDILRIRKKESKKKLRKKRARLVIKNLPFEATEENLRDYFAKYGDINDVQILKKEDGKLLGCAFIQFNLVQKARKAKHHTNGQPFLGRNLNVDFAMSKNCYEKTKVQKEVDLERNKVEIKEEPIIEEKHDKIDIKEVTLKNDSDQETGDESNSDKFSDQEMEDREDCDRKTSNFRQRTVSNDVSEGKTIFIKNVPFTATTEDLKECMSQFGPMYYALICVDKFTEHSKGTAFVKFCFKEDAEKALQAGTELTLMDNILDCYRAVNKNEVQSKQKQKVIGNKDSRNLYLVKEGVIMAGSKAAEGVSSADMAKRLQLEQYKTQMLRNLNMFVSRERLVMHNIPSNWDDTKLRQLCAKFAGEGAKIREARVMRDFQNIDAKGIGKSKEFGFITLDSHEGALNLLRNLNNNPNIFSKNKRPIVSFSIEKRSAIKTKLLRMQRSRSKNPQSKFFNPTLAIEKNKSVEIKQNNINSEKKLEDFSGTPAILGEQKMRSRYKLSTQAKKHHENLKKEKKKHKMIKNTLEERKKEFIRQGKQKINKSKEQNDKFSKLVSNYKKTISNAPSLKTKWYS